MHSCPVFLMRCMWALVHLLTLFPKPPGAHILDRRALVLPKHRQAVAFALESDPHALPPLTPYSSTLFSPSGLEMHTGQEGHFSGRVCHNAVCLVLQTMADNTRRLTDLLMVLDTLKFPLRVSPSLNTHLF